MDLLWSTVPLLFRAVAGNGPAVRRCARFFASLPANTALFSVWACGGGRLYFWLGERWTRSELLGSKSLERFDTPNEAGGPVLSGKGGAPDGENLGALVDALETFLGFGNRLNRRDPEFLDQRRMQSDSDALPAVLHAEDGARKGATETQIHTARGGFEEAVGLRRCEQVSDGFDADGKGLRWNLLETQDDFAANFATMWGGTEGKLLNERLATPQKKV